MTFGGKYDDGAEDYLYDLAVQREVDSEIPQDAAKALYRAAKCALARGHLEAITESALRAAVAKVEETL